MEDITAQLVADLPATSKRKVDDLEPIADESTDDEEFIRTTLSRRMTKDATTVVKGRKELRVSTKCGICVA